MGYLVEMPLENGGVVVVEIAPDFTGGPVRAGSQPGEIVGRAAVTLESALDHQLKPVAEAVIGRIQSFARVPDEATVELGLKLSLKAGLVIANTAGEASFRVAMKWVRPAAPEPSADAGSGPITRG